VLKTILEVEALRIGIPQEKLECKDLSLTTVNSHVTHIGIRVLNMGNISYSSEDLEHFDLFLVLVYSNSAEPNNLMREFFRVPYKGDCSAGMASCWHVTKISSIAKPSGSEVREVVNPSDYASAQWVWDSNEIAYIDIYIPVNADFTGVFVILVTSGGQIAKPANLFSI